MCTRVFIKKEKGSALTARTMDWFERFDPNLWGFPAGVTRYAMPGDKDSYSWTSKYKSIAAAVTLRKINKVELISTTDGLNEKGLVVNTLYLSESNYGEASAADTNMSMTIWGQYMLDNYASVEEAVKGWIDLHVHIITTNIPSTTGGVGKPGSQHISLSDSDGNSAIFEYYKSDGKSRLHITTNIEIDKLDLNEEDISIHYEQDCDVMTNSPVYSQQIKLNYYWQWQWDKGMDSQADANKFAKTETLPGTCRAPDRFARVSHYLNKIDIKTAGPEAIGQAFSLIKTASVPIGYIPDSDEPNISNTLWTTVSDQNKKTYYFQSTDYPNLIWIDLEKLELNDTESVLRLDINPFATYAGNVTDQMVKTRVAQFMFYPIDNLDTVYKPEQQHHLFENKV